MKIKQKRFVWLLVAAAGVCLTFYPWISNFLYERSADSAAMAYETEFVQMDDAKKERMLEEAYRYNEQLKKSKAELTDPFQHSETDSKDLIYESVLSVNGEGLMGFVEIPKIDVYLPIYHGTSEAVLKKGAGHLEGTSLPVGQEGTHAVLSAHTGSSAKMFTDLTEMKEGDLFFLHILGDVLAYRVCDIQVIRPSQTERLAANTKKDLVTLLTCTPYGVNSHRLMVTGERTEYTNQMKEDEQKKSGTVSTVWMKEYKKALLAGLLTAAGMLGSVQLAGAVKKR